jgi:multiple sugar transport system permease protein
MNSRKLKLNFFLLGFPALAGFVVLYLYPFIRTLWYSMIDNTFRLNFVFLDNYINVINNTFFQLALKNTFIFSIVSVAAIIALSLLLSFGLLRLSKRFVIIKNMLIAPMILPTSGIIFVWQITFQNDAYQILADYISGTGFWIVLPLHLLYVWKNTGIITIILSAAMEGIPTEIREAASLDGAKGLVLHRFVTLPLITPALTFVIVLSFVNALKIFRESRLFFGTDYPPDAAYTVQYFMNNHFQRLNYPTLTSASVIFTLIIVAVLFVIYRCENLYYDKIY